MKQGKFWQLWNGQSLETFLPKTLHFCQDSIVFVLHCPKPQQQPNFVRPLRDLQIGTTIQQRGKINTVRVLGGTEHWKGEGWSRSSPELDVLPRTGRATRNCPDRGRPGHRTLAPPARRTAGSRSSPVAGTHDAG